MNNFSDLNEQTIQTKYKPLSVWAYFGYLLLFCIPVVNFIAILVLSFTGENVNRKNFARGFLISNIIALVLVVPIIILSTIVIFSGLGTPDRAQFAMFCQEVDNVSMDVINSYADLKAEHAIARENRTDEQLYYEVATGIDAGEDGTMMGANVSRAGDDGENCQRINPDKNNLSGSLPEIRETDVAWYITTNGTVFNATGFVHEGKTYFTASHYKNEELDAQKSDTQEDLAFDIAEAILNKESEVK